LKKLKMVLSKQTKINLRKAIKESYGKELEATLPDEEVTEIGELLLNILAESLKIKIYEKEKNTR
jgi:hypothetical protein